MEGGDGQQLVVDIVAAEADERVAGTPVVAALAWVVQEWKQWVGLYEPLAEAMVQVLQPPAL